MKLKTLHLLFIISFLLFSIKSPAQYFLSDSKIPIIEKMTSSHKGRSLSLYDLDKIVQQLSSDGLFQIVYVESVGGNKVVIRADQSIKITGIKVLGSYSYTEQEIIDRTKLSIGEVYSQLELSQAIDKISNSYQESGFYNFKISYAKTPEKEGALLTINIDEKDFCLIEDIKIFSKNRLLNKELNDIAQSFEKTSYKQNSAKKMEEAIAQYLLDNRFLTAKVLNSATIFNKNKTRVKLNFTVTNPTQFEFIFHGNKFFSHFDLIKESKIGGKFLYLSDSSSEIIENITNLYMQAGFPQIKIDFSEKYFDSSKKKVLVFQIDEGPRIRIGKIDVIGKISRKKSYYIELFNQFLAEQAHSVYFVKEDVQKAAESLVTHLKREGHLMADLLAVTSDFTDHNNANISIQLDEGILTYVRQILFRGSKSFSNIVLRDQVEIEPNKPLRISEIEDSFDKLSQFYKNKAYLEFKIKNANASVIQYKPGQPYADIVYQLEEGPKIRVKDIRVSGNTKTKDYVLIRELDFTRGDLLTLSKVENSISRLQRTALFGKVNIKSLEQGTKKSDRTIIVEVEERKPGLFSSGIGLLSEGRLTYRGYVGMLYNNLWGKARGLSSRVDLKFQEDVNYLENRVAISYYEPFLSKERLRGRISLIREQELSDFKEDEDGSDIRSTNQILLSTEKEYSKHFRFTYNVWNFSNQETFTAKTFKPGGTINVGSTGPILEFDYRNDLFLPTDGSYSRLEVEYADPIFGSSRDKPGVFGRDALGAQIDSNEVNFFKTSFSTTLYTPLTKDRRWVWANSVSGGFLKNVSSRDDSGVPRTDSFFLGGSSTIRGFTIGTTETIPGKRELCLAQNRIVLGQVTDDCDFDDIFVRDDSGYFLIKSELRFPISGNFGGLIFYDGGGVYLGDFNLEDPYRDSVGFGFRYDTPVGSFVIQMGYKLDRKQGGLQTKYDRESDFAIHLAIGTF